MKIKSILVVDDSEAEQFLTTLAIKRFDENITVMEAYDGAEALEILATSSTQPDLILLDVNMPGMSGIEFLEHYNSQQNQSHVIVMLTSSDQTRDKAQCEKYPFVRKYITKPLTDQHLIDTEVFFNL